MAQDIPKIIKTEMQRYRSKYEYLNNFYMNFPEGFYRTIHKVFRKTEEQMEFSPAEKKQHGHSDLYCNQKRKEFFKAIDDVLIEEGIALEEIKRLQTLNTTMEDLEKFYESVFPIYVKLREKGYNRYDLNK